MRLPGVFRKGGRVGATKISHQNPLKLATTNDETVQKFSGKRSWAKRNNQWPKRRNGLDMLTI